MGLNKKRLLISIERHFHLLHSPATPLSSSLKEAQRQYWFCLNEGEKNLSHISLTTFSMYGSASKVQGYFPR